MKDSCSISDIRRQPAAVMRRAEQKGSVTVCRNGRVIGFLVSKERMEAILETLEIMANPKAMKAFRDYETGKLKMRAVSCLDDD